jgi:hypothetical protein
MFAFIASQAVALHRANQLSSKREAPGAGATPEKQTRENGLLSRAFDAIVESRLRKAKLEVEAHRRFLGWDRRR